MGTKGKFTKLKEYETTMGNHYSDAGVAFKMKLTKTKGDTCRIQINGTNAAQGISEMNGNSIRPSKEECGKIASCAHELAAKSVEADEAEKDAKKKKGYKLPAKEISGGDIYGA